jgi:hypothetical protein
MGITCQKYVLLANLLTGWYEVAKVSLLKLMIVNSSSSAISKRYFAAPITGFQEKTG